MGSASLRAGVVTYTLVYGNNGSQDATGVVITETLPANTTFDATDSTAGWVETAPGSGIYEFTIGSLAAGESAVASILP